MVIKVCRLIRDFPAIADIDHGQKGIETKVEYAHYGLAPGVYSLMREQVKLGTSMDVIAAKRKSIADQETGQGIRVHRVKKPYDVTSVLKLKKLDKNFGIDIVHAHATSGILYAFLKRFIKKPYIVHVHGSTAGVKNALKEFPSIQKQSIRSIFWDWVSFERQQFMWRKADMLLAVSSNVQNELIQFYKISSNKVYVVQNGVDIDFFKPVDEKFKMNARRGLNIHGEPLILYVGHLGIRKGIFYLLKAVPKVVKKFPRALFVIVGGTPKYIGKMDYQMTWSNITKKFDIEDNVAFVGEVKHRNIINYYAAADLFVFPTLYEGLAKVLLEAMACGLPVVATNAGGNPDVIVHEENGILVRPGNSNLLANALINLLSDESYAREMGRNARETVEKSFTWRITAEKIIRIYEQSLRR